jgi:hypothetical protein
MSWMGAVAGVVQRRKRKIGGVSEAVKQAANAIDVLDDHCHMLGDGLTSLDARQRATEALQSEHEWALTALREEIEGLKRSLQHGADARSRDARSPDAQSSDAPRPDALAPRVQPSDLQGFLAALPPPDTGDDAIAAAVRTLVAAAWTDLRREPLAHDRFPWRQPILLLASAAADRLEAFLDRLATHNPTPDLWLIGRPRDERIATEKLGRPVRFVEYSASGPYAVSACGGFLPTLRDVPFGALVFLDTGLWGDRLEHCSELLQAVSRDRVYCFGGDDRFYHLDESAERARAQALTSGLLDWYDARLAPLVKAAR